MTKAVHPSQGSSVLEPVDENDSEAVASPLVDPQFLKEKEAKCGRRYTVGDVFLAASYGALLLEFSSSAYTLWCKSHPQSDLTIHRVTLAYFGLSLILSFVFLVNSVIELRYLSLCKKKLTAREKRIKYATEYMTVLSLALWVIVHSLTIVMAEGIHNAQLQYTSLSISIMAPFTLMVASFLRMYDTYLSYRKERDAIDTLKTNGGQTVTQAQQAAAEGRAKSLFVRSLLFGIFAARMAFYFAVYVWKECILVGNTHKYFYISQKAFWICRITLGTVFLVLAVVERVLKNPAKPGLTEEQVASIADQQLSVSADISHANDDVSPLISHEKEVSITPCSQKNLIIH